MKILNPGYDDRVELVGMHMTCSVCQAVVEVEAPEDVEWRERCGGTISAVSWQCPHCARPQYNRITRHSTSPTSPKVWMTVDDLLTENGV